MIKQHTTHVNMSMSMSNGKECQHRATHFVTIRAMPTMSADAIRVCILCADVCILSACDKVLLAAAAFYSSTVRWLIFVICVSRCFLKSLVSIEARVWGQTTARPHRCNL